jgi:hypothetical protein
MDAMRHTCPSCFALTVNPAVGTDPDVLVCASCGWRDPYRRPTVFHLIGACGSGKSTVFRTLRSRGLASHVLIDTGLFFDLRADWKDPSDGFAAFKSYCLDVALDVAQAGLDPVLLGATTPEHNEKLPERRYFAAAHYLALVCDDDDLRRRLGARSWWREELIPFDVSYNAWLRKDGASQLPAITVVDTSHHSVDDVADHVLAWLERSTRR